MTGPFDKVDEDFVWPTCYYEPQGDTFVPTVLARSPWDHRAIAGGPISALLASGAEDPALDENFEVARFQVDIFGKVPSQPLTLVTEALRDARQTKLHRVMMLADGKPVAQAHVLRVRRLETPVFTVPHDYPAAETVPLRDVPPAERMGGAMSLRRVSGSPGMPGRAVGWLSFHREVIAGRTPSNFVHACHLADFGNGFGNVTDAAEWTYANLDITVQFLRMPVGEWLLIDAETHMAGNGHGTARTIFADEQGIYARGFQTIFVAPGHLSPHLPGKLA